MTVTVNYCTDCSILMLFVYNLYMLLFGSLQCFDTLLVEWQEGHPACKKWGMVGGGYWLVRMEWRPAGWSVSASVNLPLHHKVQKFSSGTGSPRWSGKKGHKMVEENLKH